MDAATKVQLTGALFVVVLPAATVCAVGLAWTWRTGREQARPLVAALALLAGLVVGYLGVAGWNAQESHRWVLFGVVGAGLLGAALDWRLPGRLAAVGLLAVAALGLTGWRLLAPLEGVWMDGGAVVQLATAQWGIEPLVWGAVVWLVVDRSAAVGPAPTTLGPLALSFVGAGVATGLSGSLLVAQLMVAMGVATATLGFLGWWRPALRPGHGAIAGALTGFVALVLYAHFYVEAPRPVMGLLLAAPLAAFAGRAPGPTWRRVALTLVLAAVPVGAAVWLAWQADQAEQAEAVEGGGQDYGSYY